MHGLTSAGGRQQLEGSQGVAMAQGHVAPAPCSSGGNDKSVPESDQDGVIKMYGHMRCTYLINKHLKLRVVMP
jgi:hypothetical protein